MGLNIETAEADELARSLMQLTGEGLTEAVTVAIRERLTRERAKLQAGNLTERIARITDAMAGDYDMRPVSKPEWDSACGDED